MEEKINILELYNLQKGLDEDIAKRHNITYESTFHRRLLALLVELGEFANETRCFKYWSFKKPSEKEVILEEYVDGLHFILSLGIYLKPTKFVYSIKKEENFDLTKSLINTYRNCVNLDIDYNLNSYYIAMQSYLNLISHLNIKPDEVIKAYKSKLEINYQRQVNKY